ncbi:hypothetical protein HMPREF1981_03248 [Bacteroides pyogenes F0041]|uniref:Uncharacterized protein n=1 Tax=Bacteroides pyogenes F0041 TaxID=1321819 RepID=U2DIR8_9BACE|nr:hypothetical protein HMPREF1981_03248 [Bacteroides pyogenes F0041]GAE23512.1 hypothetical protein JCM10003_3292 [Bacteroides pyogenes JCM 10003]
MRRCFAEEKVRKRKAAFGKKRKDLCRLGCNKCQIPLSLLPNWFRAEFFLYPDEKGIGCKSRTVPLL